MSLKIQPYHRFTQFNMKALAANYEEDYNLDSIMSGQYAKLAKVTKKQAEPLAQALALMGGYDRATLLSGSKKSVIDYADIPDILSDAFKNFETKTPGPGMYQSYGFCPVSFASTSEDAVFCYQIPGENWYLFNVMIKERKLPRSALAEPIAKRVAEFTRREQREPNRKEYAVMRDAVEAAMLKNAPVVPKVVPVIMMDSKCVVFTSSPTQAELVLNLIRTVIGTWPAVPLFQSEERVTLGMEEVIRAHKRFEENCDGEGIHRDELFFPGHAATFVDHDDSKITIKNELISTAKGWASCDATERQYRPVEMEMHYINGEDYTLTEDFKPSYVDRVIIKLAANGIVKKLDMPDVDGPRLNNIVDHIESSCDFEIMSTVAANAAMLFMIGKTIIGLNRAFKLMDMLTDDMPKPDEFSDSGTVDSAYIGLRDDAEDADVLDELDDVDSQMPGGDDEMPHFEKGGVRSDSGLREDEIPLTLVGSDEEEDEEPEQEDDWEFLAPLTKLVPAFDHGDSLHCRAIFDVLLTPLVASEVTDYRNWACISLSRDGVFTVHELQNGSLVGATRYQNVAIYWAAMAALDPNYDADFDDNCPAGEEDQHAAAAEVDDDDI